MNSFLTPSHEEMGSIFSASAWIRFVASLRDFVASPCGPSARWLFVSLLVLLLGINALNVGSSYIGRDWMTALADRNLGEFWTQTLRYAGMLALCTAALATARWVEERLGLIWRSFLTQRLVDLYLRDHFYHRLTSDPHVPNPDQRIADDVKAFTATTLSLMILTLNATLSVLAFAGVMWSISPLLFGITMAYAMVGSAATVWLGKPLVWINYQQFDREAEFRAELVQLRENSEFVALAHHESHFRARLEKRIDAFATNWRKYIRVNRTLNFFTMGYNYYIQVIPVLVVAPMYIRGEVEFGVITQSTIAFAQLLGGFSLIITQFQSISSFAAVAARLDAYSAAARAEETAPPRAIEVTESNDGLSFEDLTLVTPDGGRVLVQSLNFTVTSGTRVLVIGPDEVAKIALFRATAGLWEHGHGRILRPAGHCLCFLPERPYLPPGSLGDILASPDCTQVPGEQRIREVLGSLGLAETLERSGGLGAERDWDDLLSLGEMQRLAVARVLLVGPTFVIVDRIESALEAERIHQILGMFDAAGITYVTIARSDADLPYYESVLELREDGTWTAHPAKVAQPLPKAS